MAKNASKTAFFRIQKYNFSRKVHHFTKTIPYDASIARKWRFQLATPRISLILKSLQKFFRKIFKNFKISLIDQNLNKSIRVSYLKKIDLMFEGG